MARGLIDAHCHLQKAPLCDALPDVLARARKAGITTLLCCGTRRADWDAVGDLAATHRGVVPFFGIHPWYSPRDLEEDLEALAVCLVRDPTAGVGEIGLDFAQARGAAREQQVALFEAQWRLAVEHGRPIVVHAVRAAGALTAAVRDLAPCAFMVHAFSGSDETAREVTDLGGYLSFAGRVADPGQERLRATLKSVPPDRLLLETDAPDLLPSGQDAPLGVNEPAILKHVSEVIADFLGMPSDALNAQLRSNARQFMGSLCPDDI